MLVLCEQLQLLLEFALYLQVDPCDALLDVEDVLLQLLVLDQQFFRLAGGCSTTRFVVSAVCWIDLCIVRTLSTAFAILCSIVGSSFFNACCFCSTRVID